MREKHGAVEICVWLKPLHGRFGSPWMRLCWNRRPANAVRVVPSFRSHADPLKKVFRQFCCFEWLGKVHELLCYSYNVMPFRVSTGPRDFSKSVRVLIARWRSMGIRCTSFVDDFVSSLTLWKRLCALGRLCWQICWVGVEHQC